MALFTEILRPRVVSPFGSAADSTTPTSGIGTSGFADPGTATTTTRMIAAPTGPALDSGSFSSPLVIAAPTVTPTTTSPPATGTPVSTGGNPSGQTLLGAAGGTPIDTSGGPVGAFGSDTQTSRLLDLIAAQYASGAQGGTSPDFGGLLTAPVGPATGAPDSTGMGSDTTTSTAPAPAKANPLVLLLILAAVVGGVWYWRKHHKKRAA